MDTEQLMVRADNWVEVTLIEEVQKLQDRVTKLEARIQQLNEWHEEQERGK